MECGQICGPPRVRSGTATAAAKERCGINRRRRWCPPTRAGLEERHAPGRRVSLLTKLQDVSAAEGKASVEKRRIAAIRSAANDPQKRMEFVTAMKILNKVGLDLDDLASAPNGVALLTKHHQSA